MTFICLQGGEGGFLRNAGNFLPDYTASHPCDSNIHMTLHILKVVTMKIIDFCGLWHRVVLLMFTKVSEKTLPPSSWQNSGLHTHHGEILKCHNLINADDIWYMTKGIILKLLEDIILILYKSKKNYNLQQTGIWNKIWISLRPTNYTSNIFVLLNIWRNNQLIARNQIILEKTTVSQAHHVHKGTELLTLWLPLVAVVLVVVKG
jgi:hypothetical protein